MKYSLEHVKKTYRTWGHHRLLYKNDTITMEQRSISLLREKRVLRKHYTTAYSFFRLPQAHGNNAYDHLSIGKIDKKK